MPACVDCTEMTLRDHPSTMDEKSAKAAMAMANHGMARCKKGPGWQFNNPLAQRDCRAFKPADAQTSIKRREWLDRQRNAK